jgi:hypothetical protein
MWSVEEAIDRGRAIEKPEIVLFREGFDFVGGKSEKGELRTYLTKTIRSRRHPEVRGFIFFRPVLFLKVTTMLAQQDAVASFVLFYPSC